MEAAGYEKRNPAGSSVLIMPVHCTTQTGTRGGGDVLPDEQLQLNEKNEALGKDTTHNLRNRHQRKVSTSTRHDHFRM